MLELSVAQISAWIGLIWWPFCRIMGLFVVMPMMSSKHILIRVKLLLSLTIAVIAAPLMPQMPLVEAASVSAVLLSAEQVLLGVLMGFPLFLCLNILSVLGGILSMQMGLMMAIMNDPANGSSHALLGQWLILYGTLLFIGMDGPNVALQSLVMSFHSWPVGKGIFDFPLYELALQFSWLMAAALLTALPAVVAMLLVNLTFGVMNRAASSFNIFALGFPMAMLMGIGCLALLQQLLPMRYGDLTVQALEMLHLSIHP
ncbi:flagellar biosynthetic protein FliR [Ferrimonas lipolytica]|uniref:Flagellar biosynthetic protein FliR n=1 Tax=Ferrimonas lipolytica TaxID=2724191 RepID=A0A6H1UDA1_9GAMM|nr:flagellar biosynthetic protein FliR [Ferrimonas lipolytica]QIZ76818.1 flagellar biosynthetic protein FliR [Ferrimonas lipolytica]